VGEEYQKQISDANSLLLKKRSQAAMTVSSIQIQPPASAIRLGRWRLMANGDVAAFRAAS
jgi:hypothetical protein